MGHRQERFPPRRRGLVKGASLSILGVSVLGLAIWRTVNGLPPEGLAILDPGLFGAAANLVAAILLTPDPGGDKGIATGVGHAICVHGHCHDAPPLANGGEAYAGAIRYADAETSFSVSVQPPSATLPTLKRPPRV